MVSRKRITWSQCVFTFIFLLIFCRVSLADIKEDKGCYLIETKALSFSLNKADGTFKFKDNLKGSILREGKGLITFFNNKEKEDLSGGSLSAFQQKGNTLLFKWADKTGCIKADHSITVYPDYITWKVKPEMGGKNKAILLELGMQLASSFGDKEYTYWDGNSVVKSPGAQHIRNKWVGTFPMACVYSRKSGIAVGNAAYDLLSYLENSITPLEPGSFQIRYGTRMVVDNKVKDSVTFVLYNFEPEYGGFKAGLQKYYDIFPEYFSPLKDINPKINLGSICNVTWASGRADYGYDHPVRLEYVRRLYGAWAWAYAPFKRSGDIYGEKDLWDFTPARPVEIFKATSFSWEKFHAFRKERFAFLDGEVANCFYIAIPWCEQQLVNEKFPDSLITPEMDPDVVTVYNQPWVTGSDNEYKVFAYQTEYEKFLKEGMRKVAEEVDLYGWSCDTANDIGKYRGPALDKCKGRAFDEKGAYVDTAIAIANIMDYAHTLKNNKGKYTLGVIGNFDWGVFPASFRADAAIYENPPYYGPECVESSRYFSGRKSISWWRDYSVDNLVDWESLSPEEIKEAFLIARDNVLLSSFYLGGIPPHNFLSGVPRFFKYMPVLLDTVTTGWEPLVPVKANDKIWLSRYGKDVKSILCLGNPDDEPITSNITIENRFLGDFSYVFVYHTGEKTEQELDSTYTIISKVVIPGRTPAIFRAQIGFTPKGKSVVSASQTDDAYQSTTQISLKVSEAFSTQMVARLEENKKVFSVMLNEKPIKDYVQKENGILFKANLVAGENKIVVIQRSKTFLSPEKEVLNFPAMKDKKSPNCTIVYPANDKESERLVLRIQDYFRYYCETLTPYVKMDIPVKTDRESPVSDNMIIVDINNKNILSGKWNLRYEGEGSIIVTKDTNQSEILYVGGKDHDAVQDAILLLFRLWDKEYTYYGRFPDTTYLYMYQRPDGSFAAKKAGLVGKLLE
ncbi:MAG: hypothetical protein V2A65_04095 [Candidatus Omnitrophota bacterium]